VIIHSLGFRLHFLFPSYRCISCKQAICNAGRGNQQRLWRQSATHVEATEANNQRIRIQPASKTMQVSIHTTRSLAMCWAAERQESSVVGSTVALLTWMGYIHTWVITRVGPNILAHIRCTYGIFCREITVHTATYGVRTVFFARELLYIRPYTVYIYSSGQLKS